MNTTEKVWNSFYNNFYPGLAKPSISSGIIIILCIVFLSHSNKNIIRLHADEFAKNMNNNSIIQADNVFSMLVDKKHQ
jgi:hypothetical protein